MSTYQINYKFNTKFEQISTTTLLNSQTPDNISLLTWRLHIYGT